MKRSRRPQIAWLTCLLAASGLNAQTPTALQLATPFGDHMVLQREIPVNVWGTAAAGSKITVSIANSTATATADASGKWLAVLPALPAGGPFVLRVCDGSTSVDIKDVLIGEVWLCSGQSNMAWTLQNFKDRSDPTLADDIAAADDPMVRLGQVALRVKFAPATDTPVRWNPCTPDSAGKYSATAYFFARAMQKQLGVPVGVMNASWGGTPAEAWTNRDVLDSDPIFKPAIRRLETYPSLYPKLLAAWKQRVEELKNDPSHPALPQEPRAYEKNTHLPTVMWNAKISPLIPMTFRGVVWYQGEADAVRQQSAFYAKLLPAMFNSWRAAFGRGDDLKLVLIQLPRFGPDRSGIEGSHWAQIRDAQARAAAALPNTSLCVTLDLGKTDNEHPPTKRELGSRLASIVLGKATTAPHLTKADFSNGQATLHFSDADALSLKVDADSSDFLIAGNDQVWHPATAMREGDALTVRSKDVAVPVAVRYAWSDSPAAVLVGRDGTPIAPFRTDDWPLLADRQAPTTRESDDPRDVP